VFFEFSAEIAFVIVAGQDTGFFDRVHSGGQQFLGARQFEGIDVLYWRNSEELYEGIGQVHRANAA